MKITKHWLTAGTALALGVAWTAGPALAQQTTGEKVDKKVERAEDKAERAKEKADAKAEEAKAKAEREKNTAEMKAEHDKAKAEAKAEKTKDKAEAKADRAANKTESTMDKVKDKTSELTDAAKDKTVEMKHKMERANADQDRQEVMVMQRSLREKGFNPGPEDGIVGPRTRAALMDYQKKQGLPPSGRMDDDTKSRLGVTAMTAPDKTATSATPADPRGEKTTVNTPPPTKRNAP